MLKAEAASGARHPPAPDALLLAEGWDGPVLVVPALPKPLGSP